MNILQSTFTLTCDLYIISPRPQLSPLKMKIPARLNMWARESALQQKSSWLTNTKAFWLPDGPCIQIQFPDRTKLVFISPSVLLLYLHHLGTQLCTHPKGFRKGTSWKATHLGLLPRVAIASACSLWCVCVCVVLSTFFFSWVNMNTVQRLLWVWFYHPLYTHV